MLYKSSRLIGGDSCGKSFLFCACRHSLSPCCMMGKSPLKHTNTVEKCYFEPISLFVVTCSWLNGSACCDDIFQDLHIQKCFNSIKHKTGCKLNIKYKVSASQTVRTVRTTACPVEEMTQNAMQPRWV